VNEAVLNYYRCPEAAVDLRALGKPSGRKGYFRFGPDTLGFGQLSSGDGGHAAASELHDVMEDVRLEQSACFLPFDPGNLVDTLRWERYVGALSPNGRTLGQRKLFRDAYYLLRPVLPPSVRALLKRAALRGWDRIPFPEWPVDVSVERIVRRLLALSMRAKGLDRVPFIWFWPEGASSCALMTHDVETAAGLSFCPSLMDVDDLFGIKASFQIVPEKRYRASESFLSGLRSRGFEINVQDLDHDGLLYSDAEEFRRRAKKINSYAHQFGAKGFRSGALYRNLEWYDGLDFSYDMSVPNVAHLDPQPGGCCTVMPYFIGNLLELPLTTTQDYMLFYLLRDYSIDLWKRQIGLILKEHGLISFIIHPDYVISPKARNTYTALLQYLRQLRSAADIWMPLPREVDCWWRQRSQMTLVERGGGWTIEGEGQERARVAYAMLRGDELVYVPPERPSSASEPSRSIGVPMA